jgi:hypothetical protein
MSRLTQKLGYLATTAAILATTHSVAHSNPQQKPPQNEAAPPKTSHSYFPKDTRDRFADFYSTYLASIGEPSLLAASQDPTTVAYRLVCMYCQRPDILVIRLSLKPEWNAAITTTTAASDIHGKVTVKDRKERTTSARELDGFFTLVEKAAFWSMPSSQQDNSGLPKYDAALSQWVFEGARNGTYHVVFREGPEPSPFTDMVCFLARDLAKLDEPTVPRPYGAHAATP